MVVPAEPYLSLNEATEFFPGRKVSLFTVRRYALDGVLTRSGRRVFLQHRVSGRTRYTTVDWIGEFLRERAAADQVAPTAVAGDVIPAPKRQRATKLDPTTMSEHRAALELFGVKGGAR